MTRGERLDCTGLRGLADELILLVLRFLDIPDLLALSRTCHRFRKLSLDPILHLQRIHNASLQLSATLPLRPAIATLRPPQGTIYLSNNNLVAKSLSKQFVTIYLKKKLSRRPSASSLVEHNILPVDCYGRQGVVAPSLVGARRSIERERIKDSLRAWLEYKQSVTTGGVEAEARTKEEQTVKGLIRRFTAWRNASGLDTSTAAGSIKAKVAHSYGPLRPKKQEAPTRAHVWGMRKFWEGLAKRQIAVN